MEQMINDLVMKFGLPGPLWAIQLGFMLIFALTAILLFASLMAGILTYAERRVAGKIQSRLRKVREGDLSDPRFTSRMRGEGELADLISRFFTLARKRYGLDGHHHELATEHFRRRSHLQLDLF